jgi:hypothetical protein
MIYSDATIYFSRDRAFTCSDEAKFKPEFDEARALLAAVIEALDKRKAEILPVPIARTAEPGAGPLLVTGTTLAPDKVNAKPLKP